MKERGITITTTGGNELNPVLPAVLRPKTADEAIKLLKEYKLIEIQSIYAFDLMRYVQEKESNFRFTCKINQLNEGWTLIEHCR